MKRLVFLVLVLLVLAGCSTPAPATVPAPTAVKYTALPTPTSTGLDLKSIDVCTMMPQADVESVFGTLRGDPKVDPPNGPEKGCTYYNQQGHFVDISLHPVEEWSLLRQLQPDAVDSTVNGDKAFSADKPDGAYLWVLRPSKAIIEIRLSSKDPAQAKQFIPKVIARLP
jgi:hypothetical protein